MCSTGVERSFAKTQAKRVARRPDQRCFSLPPFVPLPRPTGAGHAGRKITGRVKYHCLYQGTTLCAPSSHESAGKNQNFTGREKKITGEGVQTGLFWDGWCFFFTCAGHVGGKQRRLVERVAGADWETPVASLNGKKIEAGD